MPSQWNHSNDQRNIGADPNVFLLIRASPNDATAHKRFNGFFFFNVFFVLLLTCSLHLTVFSFLRLSSNQFEREERRSRGGEASPLGLMDFHLLRSNLADSQVAIISLNLPNPLVFFFFLRLINNEEEKEKERKKKNNVRDSLAINNRLLASCSFPFVPSLSFSIYIYLYAT